jgi:hypothetical protein
MPATARGRIGQDRVDGGGRAVHAELPGGDHAAVLTDDDVPDRDDPVVEVLAADQLRHHVVQLPLAGQLQTNEPARCAALLPALAMIDGPLALIEVGTSAGLCLYPDRYSYEYDDRPVGPRRDVHLHCATSGTVPLPATLPQVDARIGIDLNPLDVTDPDDLAWLRALVWQGPVEAERLQRLDAAAAVAAQEPPVLLTGDLVERLPDALSLLPAGATPVVLHTAVLPYVGEARRTAFVERVRSLPVRWVAQEGAGMVPGTGRPYPGGWGPYFVLSLDGRPLARTAPHGGRVDWLEG